ncbi:AfsR/SARP family transcriptional regulator [Nocardioides mangrovi]|uniref:Winged helix-turn-helix domain-containing protein n=1 Tax=Nocardioides mangrovi TaxID=2874580 RepID=A0ABS7UHL2_9ACTN|nr:BTAD domain-containing putative transcriptional regulator [Nocardioides mangrovi]MBZ5740324.1 winged helix-turn-helix domain-containing protein [Nocardioides mangrovi]
MPTRSDPSLRLQILGPLRVWRGHDEIGAGPRQQAHLLTLLAARQGQPTGVDELVDLLWGEHAPASARNVLHKYVGSLRRLLEPSLPPRRTGSYLCPCGNGYLFRAGGAVLDVARFDELTRDAAAALARDEPRAALDRQVEALGLWAGPAGAGLSQEPAMAPVFARLNDSFLDTCVSAADLAVAHGMAARVLPPLHLATSMAPFHEPVHASLMVALAAAGRHADALAVYTRVRDRLDGDLGIDPGPALRAAQRRVLEQTVGRPVRPAACRGERYVGRTHRTIARRHHG